MADPISGVEWYYDSTTTQNTPQTIDAGDYDATEGIIICAPVSDVTSTVVSGGYFNIKTGANTGTDLASGRIGVDYWKKARYTADDKPGFNTAFTFTFVYNGAISIGCLDGNDPLVSNLNKVFEGFTFNTIGPTPTDIDFFSDAVSTRVQYYTNPTTRLGRDEPNTASIFPGGRSLEIGNTYKIFGTVRTNRITSTVVGNLWVDFGDGAGWTKVATDRTWNSSMWDPGVNVPSGFDDTSQILSGPAAIKRFRLIIRNNNISPGGTTDDLKVKDIKVGTLPYLDSITIPPPDPGGTKPLYRFLSWGDNDTTSDAEQVLTRMMTETDVAQYLFAGDGPYSSSATAWTTMMTTYFDATKKAKLILAKGNHDDEESESSATETGIEAWMPSLNNATDALDWTSAKVVGNAYVLTLNSQDPNIDQEGGTQYNYVVSKLNEAKALRAAGTIDWIITMVHKSWFNLLGSNPSYVTARHAYASIFRDAQVDFMFHGHNHSYAIWRPIVDIADEDENTAAQEVFTLDTDGRYNFAVDHGAFYIINGNGGHEINTWGEDPADFPNILYANDQDFGYTVLDIQGKQATIKAKDVDGNVLFTVGVTRGPDGPGTPPAGTLTNLDGRTFITVGTGGRSPLHSFSGSIEPFIASRANTYFGSLFVTLQNNGTELKLQFIENAGQIVDSVTLAKPGAIGTLPATCPTGYHLDTTLDLCIKDEEPGGGGPPPPPPVQPILRIGMVGDTPDGSVQEDIWADMALKAIHHLHHLGDVSYSNDVEATTDLMVAALPAAIIANSTVTLGNHDHPNEDGSQADLDDCIDFWNLNVATQYCTKKVIQNVYMITMNSQDPNYNVNGGVQHLFVQASLAEAIAMKAAGTIDWIIIFVHKPPNAAPDDHPADEEGGRSLYQPMFQTAQVDFVFSGHNHLLEISHPLSGLSTTQYTETDEGYDFRQPHGQIYCVVGTGGRTRDSHDSSPAWFRYLNEDTYGWLMLTLDTTGKNMTVQFIDDNGDTQHSFVVTKGTVVVPPPPVPCPSGQHRDPVTNLCVPDTAPPGTGGVVDSRGIRWLAATGGQGVIAKTRENPDDHRWSGNVSGVRQYGFESTMILDFRNASVASDGHFAMKHWGPNHSSPCAQSEDGDCCCWYDTGIRSNGDIQLQTERPHPSNHDFTETTLMDNVGKGLEGNIIGLKWIVNPLIPGGTSDNGGIRLRMYVDTDGLSGTLPTNNWRLVYDFVDNGQILGDYDPGDDFDFEVRNSGTDGQEDYGGGLHWRRRTVADVNK